MNAVVPSWSRSSPDHHDGDHDAANLQTIPGTLDGLIEQMQQMTDTATAMGGRSTHPRATTTSICRPEVFQNADFQKGLKLFLSPDGKAARLIITHDVNPPPRRAHRGGRRRAARSARGRQKGTSLADADIYLTGTAATYRDIQSGAKVRHDDRCLRRPDADLHRDADHHARPGGVHGDRRNGRDLAGAAFGLSVFIFERIFGVELNWIVLAFAVIILMAVGGDYNLLLVSRFKEEIGAGINTGIIRSMGNTGSVVTAADWCSPSPWGHDLRRPAQRRPGWV